MKTKTYTVISHSCPSGLALRQQPEMDKPKQFIGSFVATRTWYEKKLKEHNAHIASLEIIEIAIEYKEHWKKGDSVSENEFCFKYETYQHLDGKLPQWVEVAYACYQHSFEDMRRKFAIPIVTTGIELIIAERQEQITKHGYTSDHDDNYTEYQLQVAAEAVMDAEDSQFPAGWDLVAVQKMCDKSPIGRMVIAGALYMAEKERIERRIKDIASAIDKMTPEQWLKELV